MQAVSAILLFVFNLVGQFVLWMTSAVVGQVVAMQVAEAIMRAVRVGIILALLIGIVNLLVPDGIPLSLGDAWNVYEPQLGSFGASLGYFLPVDLFASLLDLYMFGVTVCFAMFIVRKVVEASQ